MNRRQVGRKTPNILDEWKGYPDIFSPSRTLEISRQYLLLRTATSQTKKVVGCPCMNDTVRFSKLQPFSNLLPGFTPINAVLISSGMTA